MAIIHWNERVEDEGLPPPLLLFVLLFLPILFTHFDRCTLDPNNFMYHDRCVMEETSLVGISDLVYGVGQAFPATTTTRKPELFKSNVLSTQRHI